MQQKIIAVFGSGMISNDDDIYKQAYECGRLLARNGYIVINGAYTGVMEAVSKGAKLENGYVIGVPLTAFRRDKTNDYLDEVITTHSYDDRIRTLVSKADAYLILKGGIGTLSELYYCWCTAQVHYPYHKPIILIGKDWKEDMKLLSKHFIIPERDLAILHYANTPQEAIDLLSQILRK
jgi:uncharacterized protein (TIGR00730 family)